MRNYIFAATLVIGTAFAAPASAQYTVGTTGPAVGVIADEYVPTFRRYVVEERIPSYTIPDRVVVGSTLPDAGIVYYDVPERFGGSTYRYTVVNDHPVLVEPRTRRIIQVID
jgi:hypothetical protein